MVITILFDKICWISPVLATNKTDSHIYNITDILVKVTVNTNNTTNLLSNRVCNKNNTTSVTSGAGTAYLSGNLCFSEVRIAWYLLFSVEILLKVALNTIIITLW